MLTFGATAPDESVTVPTTVAVVCAQMEAEAKNRQTVWGRSNFEKFGRIRTS